MRLVADFIGHVRRAGLLGPGDRVVVACSGGADSMALLHLVAKSAKRLGLASVTVAHLDHGLRTDSRDDAAFVVRLAARLSLPCVTERQRVRPRRGESPEAAGRRVRYDFLERTARAARAAKVLTAHHMDDQAETVLLRILRGTGPRGLGSIRPERPLRKGCRIRVARPLLPFRRARLRDWLARWGEAWREDPTNVDGNVRARLRNEAIPVLRECCGRDPVPLLARLADHARSASSRGSRGSVARAPERRSSRRSD